MYNGRKVYLSAKNFKTIGISFYGRCYETVFQPKNEYIRRITITFKHPLYIYVNIPNRFLDDSSRFKLHVNVNEYIFVELNYEIFKSNHGKICRNYSHEYKNSFNKCEYLNQEKIEALFNCTVPFLATLTGGENFCSGTEAELAARYYKNLAKITNTACPDACENMITSYGIPSTNNGNGFTINGTGKVKLYPRKIIKVTEDFISYDFLRFAI